MDDQYRYGVMLISTLNQEHYPNIKYSPVLGMTPQKGEVCGGDSGFHRVRSLAVDHILLPLPDYRRPLTLLLQGLNKRAASEI